MLADLATLMEMLGRAIMSARTHKKAAEDEARGGCLACGATDTETRADTRTCRACGYVGRADGGGQLGPSELDAVYKIDR